LTADSRGDNCWDLFESQSIAGCHSGLCAKADSNLHFLPLDDRQVTVSAIDLSFLSIIVHLIPQLHHPISNKNILLAILHQANP
jgi:hypothetical protein